jgi:hypothetical protein
MGRSRRKNNDFRFIRGLGFVRAMHQPAPRPIMFTRGKCCLFKRGAHWYAGRLGDGDLTSPVFGSNATAAYLYALCEGWTQ